MVGAGLSNASLAAMLKNYGYSILVVDSRRDVGGNCHTSEMGGITVHDYGAHIFHTSNEAVWKFANTHANFVPFQNSPVARVRLTDSMKSKLYPPDHAPDYLYLNMPFNMNTFSKIWWTRTPEQIRKMLSKNVDQFKGNPVKSSYRNLEEKARGMVGDILYELLVKGYTEKQWGKPCSELPADGIINRLPVRFDWNNNYFNDKYQGIPEDGYTNWIADMMQNGKIDILLGVDYLENRAELDEKADIVFYSGRLDELFGKDIGELPFRSLNFRVEDISGSAADCGQGVAVMNYTTDDVPYTRTIEHRLFCPWKPLTGHTVISTEYPAEMKPGSEPYYPVNNAESDKLYNAYASRLVRLNNKIVPTGRLGLFKYMDMDDCIAESMEINHRILYGANITEEPMGTDTYHDKKILMLRRAVCIHRK